MEWCLEKRPTSSLLDIALNHLLLGRAALTAAPGPDHPDFKLARHHLDAAVAGLRKAGRMDYQPRGLLARAALHRLAADLAMSLTNLGNKRSTLGRHEPALVAAEEAVALRRVLAAARPDAFAPDLATSLNNLGNTLSDLGRPEPALAAAEEAVALFRALAATHPDAFTPDLAMSLNNLGNKLSTLGHHKPALAAAEEAYTHAARAVAGDAAASEQVEVYRTALAAAQAAAAAEAEWTEEDFELARAEVDRHVARRDGPSALRAARKLVARLDALSTGTPLVQQHQARARLMLGSALQMCGEAEASLAILHDARDGLTTALAFDPSARWWRAICLDEWGDALVSLGRYAEACEV